MHTANNAEFISQYLEKEKDVQGSNVQLLCDALMYRISQNKDTIEIHDTYLTKLCKTKEKEVFEEIIKKKPMFTISNWKEGLKIRTWFDLEKKKSKMTLQTTVGDEIKQQQTTPESILDKAISGSHFSFLSWFFKQFETYKPLKTYLQESIILRNCISMYCSAARSDQNKWMRCLPLIIKLSGKEVINMPFGEGSTTLLHIACETDLETLIYELLENGANWQLKNSEGKVAMDVIDSTYLKTMMQKKIDELEKKEDATIQETSSSRTSLGKRKQLPDLLEKPNSKRNKK